jgi:hypothetical protein
VASDVDTSGIWQVLAVRGSIAAATLAWATAECLRWRAPWRFAGARAAWSIGALLVVVHSVAVFHFIHQWNHDAALAHTAQQTSALTGLDWSWGLYVNYVFITLWIADCAWAWLDPVAYRQRSLTARDTLLAVFLFMFVNGAVIFAPWPSRALGIAAVAAVVWSRWTAQKAVARSAAA